MIIFASISEKRNCTINEDSLTAHCMDGNFGFLIADGLGGHNRGEAALDLVSEQAIKCFEKNR